MRESAGTSPLKMPAAGDLLLRFVNSNAGGQPEQFADAASLRRWTKTLGFDTKPLTGGDVEAARGLRKALQAMLLAHSSNDPSTVGEARAAEQLLAEVAPRYPLKAVVTVEGAQLKPLAGGLDGLLGAVLASVGELAQSGAWPRFKACQNPICHESFFDRSRNGSAIYHAASCSAMVGMRKYRQRKKAQDVPPDPPANHH